MDGEIEALLAAYGHGDPAALDRLLPLVYADLKRLARRERYRGGDSPTMSTTVLVHEAYLKLADSGKLALTNRLHFMALCARAMRQVLVDHARARLAQKRGAGQAVLSLETEDAREQAQAQELVALEQALAGLLERDPRLAQTIELAWFAGLDSDAIAELRGVNVRTVQRELQRARAWLAEAMTP